MYALLLIGGLALGQPSGAAPPASGAPAPAATDAQPAPASPVSAAPGAPDVVSGQAAPDVPAAASDARTDAAAAPALSAAPLSGAAQADAASDGQAATAATPPPAASEPPPQVLTAAPAEPSAAATPAARVVATSTPSTSSALRGTELASDQPKEVALVGYAEYFRKLALDPDPANDQYLVLYLKGSWYFLKDLVPRLSAQIIFGALQRFAVAQGESGLRGQDIGIGLGYGHKLDLAPLLPSGSALALTHGLRGYIPTAFSHLPDYNRMYTALRYLNTTLLTGMVPGLNLGVDLDGMLYFFEYAERPGPGAPMNDQLRLYADLYADYTLLDRPDDLGTLSVGAALSSTWRKRYASALEYQSDWSSTVFWDQEYGWLAFVDWSPLANLSVTLNLQQGGAVRRDGLFNINLFHRDETELSLRVTGTY